MRIFLFTLGCPKNIVDSERLAGTIYALGHELVSGPDQADLIILNTCAFVSGAEKEASEHIEGFSKKAPLAIIGCLPSRRKKIPETYGPVPPGTDEILSLARLIFWNPDEGTRFLDDYPYAYLKIAEGCSRKCSFCVIPRIRGHLRSRSIGALVEEARAMLELGKKEIILIAQETTQFGRDTGERLEDLLVSLDRLKGDFWLRLMYVHPGGMTKSLASTLASLDHLVPYLHMPVQHISDPVLRAMVRAGGGAAVTRALSLIEKYLPDAFLRTELMVGFPGETTRDFRLLLDAIDSGVFHRVAVFPFYREEGSGAYRMKQISESVILRRYREALDASHALHIRVQKSLVGRKLRLLVDRPGFGRIGYDAPDVDFSVRLPKGLPVGKFLDVRITRLDENGDMMAVSTGN